MRPPARKTTVLVRNLARVAIPLLGLGLGLASGPSFAEDLPAGHGSASSAPLFVPDLPVGTVAVRLARPSMTEAIAGTAVLGSWTAPGGEKGSATSTTGDDGRAVFADVPVGATFRAQAKVDGITLDTTPFEVPPQGGTRLLLVVGPDAEQAMAGMTGPAAHAAGARLAPVRGGTVTANPKLPAGTVELKVLAGDGQPLPGVTVTLAKAQAKGDGIELERADSDPAGVARFAGLPRGKPGDAWAAVVEHDGMRVGSELFTLAGEHGASGELRIPSKTSALAVLRLSAHTRLMIEPREDALAVLQNLVIENTSQQAFAPGPRGLLIPLPDGCEGAEKMAGGAEVELVPGSGAILRSLIPPTTTPTAAVQIRLGCVIVTRGAERAELVQPLPLGLEGALVMLPARPAVGLAGQGLRALPPERDDLGNELQLYELGRVPAGQPLRLTVTELPMRPRAGKWIAGALALGLVAGGLVMARRPRRTRPEAKE